MFEKIKEKINENRIRQEEIREEQERLEEHERIREKAELMQLSEKELLVELLLKLRNIEENKHEIDSSLSNINSTIWSK